MEAQVFENREWDEMGNLLALLNSFANEGRAHVGNDLGIRFEERHIGKCDAVTESGAGVDVKGYFLE